MAFLDMLVKLINLSFLPNYVLHELEVVMITIIVVTCRMQFYIQYDMCDLPTNFQGGVDHPWPTTEQLCDFSKRNTEI